MREKGTEGELKMVQQEGTTSISTVTAIDAPPRTLSICSICVLLEFHAGQLISNPSDLCSGTFYMFTILKLSLPICTADSDIQYIVLVYEEASL